MHNIICFADNEGLCFCMKNLVAAYSSCSTQRAELIRTFQCWSYPQSNKPLHILIKIFRKLYLVNLNNKYRLLIGHRSFSQFDSILMSFPGYVVLFCVAICLQEFWLSILNSIEILFLNGKLN